MLFARLIGARIDGGDLPLLGLDRDAFAALMTRHFPRDTATPRPPLAVLQTPHRAFVRDLHGLLMWHDRIAAENADDARCLASIIAAAALRPDHLWRDLGLSGRDDVTAMLGRHYPELIARNTENLRWKKFLAQEVAHANGVAPTCAPGCPGCEDYGFCYPAETLSGVG
ncbi:Nitrogenase FeMo-cofactor synthesis molybdenum delivery protein NifQ [Candidatus Burkholderia verschuerenii]|uniref:Nitrogenase FeMo-cofactor synthesis molybdenum delivery protein NifQ n=1 Tax=Candidatus Burkholderia verschuerenii TaxID=242163 RepID=A0A0L0MEV0_9BURK|nr:nitrogen fixation protein NifQ [Candidatus Burkholderia verschuerenii]KND60831.1 Nitrogenase FeMo-cofactor synthesis molybdenum delivery protein NifQ [Candidatus Burkholderia verschuerenii]